MAKPTTPRLVARVWGALLFTALAVIVAGCPKTPGTTTAADDDYYDDWWLCANNCGEEDADCVDACTDEFNETHSGPQREEPLPFKLRRRTGDGPGPMGFTGQLCPAGTEPSAFPMPIYDPIGPDGIPGTADDGLFVDHFETVWYCLPEDLEPAG